MGQAVSLSLSLFDPPLRQPAIRRKSAVIDGNEPGGGRRVSHSKDQQTNHNSRVPVRKTRPRWGNRGRKDPSFVGKLPGAMQCSKDFSVIVMDWWRRRLTVLFPLSCAVFSVFSVLSA